MTLRELPPEDMHPATFNAEMEKGGRPQFVSVVRKFARCGYSTMDSNTPLSSLFNVRKHFCI